MKKYFTLLMLLSFITAANAQFTLVKNLSDNKLLPMWIDKGRLKVWKGKAFYQGQSVNAPSPYHYKNCNLVISDGTEAGTKLLKDISRFNFYDTFIAQWAATDNYLYFTHKLKEGVYELWRTDGTTEGTIKVDSCWSGTTQLRSYISLGPNRDAYTQAGSETMNYPDNFEDFPLTIGNKFYYTKYDPTDKLFYMYETTGTPESVQKIPGDYNYKYELAMSYIVYNNKLYFRGAGFTVNQYSGVKSQDAKFFVYDGTSVSPTTVYGEKFNGVFNGKLYYQIGAQLFSTTNLGVNQKDESTPTCSGSPLPGPYAKTNYFLQTGNFVILSGNYPCESDKYYLLDKNGQRKPVIFPPNNAVQEIVKDNNTAYFYTYEYTVTNVVNGTEIRAKTGNYYLTKVNPDLSFSSVLVYNGNGGAIDKGILYYADLTEQRTTLTTNGSNDELWRTNGSVRYMAKEVVDSISPYGYNYNTQTYFDVKVGSQPRLFFNVNGKICFVANGKNYKTNLYSLVPDFTFTNAASNNKWSDSNNWKSNVLPFQADSVTIPSGSSPIIDGEATVKSMKVQSPINLTAGNLTVGGNLDLGAKITLNNNNLNLAGSASNISNANSTNYIVTNGTGSVNVENMDAARGTVNIPIGTATHYTPVSISNAGTSDTFSARVSEGNTSPFASVNATWEISEATAGGSNASITLGWNGGQEFSNFNRANGKVGHYTGGEWKTENSTAVTGTNPYSITASGITSFSPFTVLDPSVAAKVNTIKNSLHVYPNPCVDKLMVNSDGNSELILMDAQGRQMMRTALKQGENTLNVSALSKGIYLGQIKNMVTGEVSTGKIVKQ